MKLLSRMILVALAPALAGCAVADLAAHAVKEYDKSRDAKPAIQPAAAPAEPAPAYQPAASPQQDDPPTTLAAPPAPARESISVEPLR